MALDAGSGRRPSHYKRMSTPHSFCPTIDDIFWNYFRVETEDLWVGRVDRCAHPMSVWIAEGFNPRKVLKQSICLLAIERLVDPEQVRIAV